MIIRVFLHMRVTKHITQHGTRDWYGMFIYWDNFLLVYYPYTNYQGSVRHESELYSNNSLSGEEENILE